MATTTQPAVGIRSQISTPETTTAQTLNMLRAILGLDLQNSIAPAAPETGRQASARRPPPKTKPSARPVKRKDATQFPIHEPKSVAPPPLDVKERKKFATETFNATLKQLSGAARTRQQEKVTTPARARTTASRDAQALQNCSPNGKAPKASISKALVHEPDLQPTAQCANTALECLRQLHEQTNSTNSVDMGLENGGLVLLDKLISLELGDEAEAQSRRLYKQYWKRRNDPKADHDCGDAFARMKTGTEDNAQAHKFATSLQGQLIRLAILQSPMNLQGTFVEHLRIETEGSPASMIVRGHELGFLDAETAGTQLRTLSLALSKLHATIPAKVSAFVHEQSIQLVTIALQIKCTSWKLLGHEPELDRELWNPLSKATLKASKALKDAQRLQSITADCVSGIRNTLKEHGLPQEVPTAMRRYCPLAEQRAQKSEDMSRLEKTMTKLDLGDTAVLLPSLQVSLTRVEQWKAQPKAAVIAMQNCIEALQRTSEPRGATDEELIAIAHLRKAAVSAADEIVALQKSSESTDGYNELHVCLIRAIYSFVAYCHSSFKSGIHQGPGSTSTITSKSKSNAILSYAKTMESVFHFEQQMVTRSVLLEDETHQTLDVCLDFVSTLISHLDSCAVSAPVVKFIRGVPLRISHAYWSRYLFYTESKRPVTVRIGVLLQSISSVDHCSSEERLSAMLSLKHEKLSSLWVESKSFSKAQASLALAIQASIDQGLAEEAAKLCLAQSGGLQSVDNKSPVCRFAQTLARYVALSLEHSVPNGRGTWYHDSHGLQGIERAMLLELQLLAGLEGHATRLKPAQVKSLLLLWEQLSFEPKYRVYQLRTVSQLLHMMAKHKHLDAGDILGSLIVRQESLPQALPKDTVLMECLSLIRPLESIQWAFAANSMCESLLTKHWDDLRVVLEQLVKGNNLDNVPNPSILLATMTAVTEYAGVLGIARIQLEAAEMSTKILDVQAAKHDRKLAGLLTIAVAGVELDRTTEAGKALAAAEKLCTDSAIDQVQWALGSAEYHFCLGNAKRSTELLLGCCDQFIAIATSCPRERLQKEVQLSRAALLASRLALVQGSMTQAMHYARQSVKLSSGIWASLEKTLQVSDSPQLVANDASLSGLTHDLSNLSIDSQSSTPTINHHGTKYWNAISIHRSVLRHTASLSAHNGIYQDALYFAQQAAKIAAWTGCKSLRYCVTSELAVLYAGAQENKASLILFPSNGSALTPEASVNYAQAALHLGDPEKAQSLLSFAQPDQNVSTAVTVKATARTKAPAKRVKTARSTTAKTRKTAVTRVPSPIPEALPTPARTVQTKTWQAQLQILQDELRISGVEHGDAEPVDFAQLSPGEMLSKGSVFVHEAMKQFSADPANNAIAETALALPVKCRSIRKSGQMSLLLESPAKINRQPSTELATTGDGLLQQAYDWLRIIESGNLAVLPTDKVTLLHQLLSRVVILSTALKRPLSYSPLSTVLQSLRPKDASRYRERCVILAEQQTAERQQIQVWPSLAEERDCQQDYSDLMQVLPSSWTIISLGLSPDGKDLLLSKISNGRTPFLMRVPLERPGVDDDEPCEFTLEYAREELRDVVQKANDTAHDRRGQGDKAERKAWYAEREFLDKRMKLLLANIENIWLGGFRGLLSPTSPDEALLSRFGESLVQTLGKHLPSRQKKAKSKIAVDLHAHVLELFTSVAFEEADADFEDSITDLLYFVVDILQFNGEANAFDEIDFDAMLVDTIDALRGYHAAADKAPAQHTILVIDKELQAFPWESLPCLRGRPASRMPSLSAIKERLDLMQSDTYTIPRSGSYILNPSNDLPNTQATFEPLLSPLSFEALTASPPTEATFARLLSTSALVLYFGHGAGLQYIRGRTIRKMPTCAVTWLMGCSSAKLTECGIFESHGVPWHYMHAGAPAVVGTLWDVTDRDIDRFAVRALADWGLLDAEGLEEGFWGRTARGKMGGSKGKGKGKGKVIEDVQWEEKMGPVPLDEAVAGARDACQLRYLNGAAVVVYGVPVSLE